jgi:hypothetical protein
MAALAPIPARKLKAMFEADGYVVMHEDDHTWTLDRGPEDEILDIPKEGGVLAMEVMDSLLSKARINDRKYFELLDKISG